MSVNDIKLFIDTLGCPKNFNDSEAAAGIWEKAGMSITDDPATADAIMINTCGFINDAKKESIDHIFDMISLAEAREAEGLTRPTLIVSGFLVMAAIQSFFFFFFLENINRKNRQDFEMKLIETHREKE